MRMYFQTESVASGKLAVEDDQPHCYQCYRPVNYLFTDGRCSRCTRVQPE